MHIKTIAGLERVLVMSTHLIANMMSPGVVSHPPGENVARIKSSNPDCGQLITIKEIVDLRIVRNSLIKICQGKPSEGRVTYLAGSDTAYIHGSDPKQGPIQISKEHFELIRDAMIKICEMQGII